MNNKQVTTFYFPEDSMGYQHVIVAPESGVYTIVLDERKNVSHYLNKGEEIKIFFTDRFTKPENNNA